MVAVQVTGQGSQLGLQFRALPFQLGNDGMDTFHGSLGRDQTFLILEVQQFLAGVQHLGLGLGHLLVQEFHLHPGQGMAHFIHEAFAFLDQHAGNGLRGFGIIGLGADAHYSRIVIVFHGNSRKVVAMEPFDGGILEPHA